MEGRKEGGKEGQKEGGKEGRSGDRWRKIGITKWLQGFSPLSMMHMDTLWFLFEPSSFLRKINLFCLMRGLWGWNEEETWRHLVCFYANVGYCELDTV